MGTGTQCTLALHMFTALVLLHAKCCTGEGSGDISLQAKCQSLSSCSSLILPLNMNLVSNNGLEALYVGTNWCVNSNGRAERCARAGDGTMWNMSVIQYHY